MSSKKKTVIWLSVFAAALILVSVLYAVLSKRYAPDIDSGTGTQSSLASAPDFTIIDGDGNSVSLSDFAGSPVVVNFWTSWCGPCKSEMPDYEEMYREYSEKGVVFMMVNMTDGSRETVRTAQNFIASKGYTFPVYFDTLFGAATAYRVSSIPYSVFINRDGKIVYSQLGIIDGVAIEKSLEKIMK